MFTTSGSVLGGLLSARKLVIVPEGILYHSSWRTPRRLSSLSVYLIMVEYICQDQEKQKRVCFLEAMLIKIVAIFRVCIIISSVHIRVEHSILRAPKSTSRSHFLCTTWAPACPNSESVSNLQRGERMFLWIVWCSIWWMKNNYLFRGIKFILPMWMEQQTLTFLTYCRYHHLTQA